MSRKLLKRPDELLFDVEEGELGSLDEKDAGGAEARHLPRELGSDRTSRPRDHDGLAVHEFADGFVIELDGIPAEKVFRFDVADPAHLHAALEDLREARNDPDVHRHLVTDLDQSEDLGPSNLRDRDDDLLDAQGPHDLSEVLRRPEDRESVQDHPLLGGVVVEKAPHPEIRVFASFDLSRRDPPGLAGSNEKCRDPRSVTHARPRAAPLRRLVEQAPEKPHPEDPDEPEDAADEDHGEGHAPVAECVREG